MVKKQIIRYKSRKGKTNSDYKSNKGLSRSCKLQNYKKKNFLKFYKDSGNISHACRVAEINSWAVYNWMKKDPVFAEEMKYCEEIAVQKMEEEAHRRAVTGINKPVYHNGVLVDRVKQYSDTLLIFLLKAKRPKTYRDNIRIETTGKNGGPIKVSSSPEYDLSRLSVVEKIQMRDLMMKVTNSDVIEVEKIPSKIVKSNGSI